MAIEFVVAGGYAHPAAGSTSATFDLPVGMQEGDFICLHGSIASSSATISSGPSGFTLLGQENPISQVNSFVYYKIADGSDSGRSVSITVSSGNKFAVTILVYRGVDGASPINNWDVTSATGGTQLITPAVTTSADCVEIAFATQVKGFNVTQVSDYTTPSPLTERWESITSTTVSGAAPSNVGADNLTPATSLGSREFLTDQSRSSWAAWTIGLNAGETFVPAPPATFEYNWSGAQTDNGGTVSTLTTNATSVRLKVADNEAMTTNVRYTSGVVPDTDGWAKHTISDMTANSEAFYQVETTNGDDELVVHSLTSRIQSLPTPGLAASFSFTASSCFGHHSPNRTGIAIDGMRTQNNPLFSVFMGDYGYYDTATDSVADHRANYLDIVGPTRFPDLKTLFEELQVYYIKSDHDSGPPDNNPDIYTDPNRQAYKQVFPHPALSNPDGIYFSFLVGRVRFIFTDSRYLRSPRADTDNSSKSMLGTTQKQWLKDRLVDTGEIKVWIHESEWVGQLWSASGDEPYSLGTDSWARYRTEQTEIGNFIVANNLSDRIFYLSGNGHHLSADDGTNNAYGGFASACAAPVHRDSAHTGGPWSEGSYVRGTEGDIVQQFCSVTVNDTGGDIELTWEGYDALDTSEPVLTYTMSVQTETIAADEGTLSIVESAELLKLISASDQGAVQIDESIELFTTINSADQYTLSIDESVGVFTTISSTDQAALTIVESIEAFRTLGATDTLTIGFVETLAEVDIHNSLASLSAQDLSSVSIEENSTVQIFESGEMGIYVYTGGEWVEGQVYVYSNGQWHVATLHNYRSGGWH